MNVITLLMPKSWDCLDVNTRKAGKFSQVSLKILRNLITSNLTFLFNVFLFKLFLIRFIMKYLVSTEKYSYGNG